MLDDDRFLTAAAAVACECDLLFSVCVVPWTGATAFVTWSAGSDSGTVCSVVLIVADIALLLLLLTMVAPKPPLIPLPLSTGAVAAATDAILTSVTLTRFGAVR